MNRAALRILAAIVLASATAGCTGLQAAMDPAGTNARHVSRLWWFFCTIGIVTYVVTMAFVILSIRKRRRLAPQAGEGAAVAAPEIVSEQKRERKLSTVVSVSVGMTTVILLVLMFAEFYTARALAGLSADPNAMKVRVIARQWWWEFRFEERPTSEIVIAANEIHIPVGRTVQFDLESPDVIHSFWVPKLSGKKDIIPGHGASLYVKAEQPGTYFGQCAEFCGYQHAKMRFIVVADPPEEFEKWRAAQLAPPNPPATDGQARGQEVFLGSTCIMCHTVSGTHARGSVGPNLTHVGSRMKIAAGSLDNTREHLKQWIADPQRIKAGVRMPQHNFQADDLNALAEYLESLK
jgi:cytochrome c oxidase subunit 2